MTYTNRTRITPLPAEECWSLLRAHQYGVARVAFLPPGSDADAAPELLPVNYLIDRDSVVVQTGEGLLHDAALHGRPVTVEIDAAASPGHGERPTAWSVVVRGSAEVVDEAAQQAFLRLSHLSPAAGGFKPNFVRIPVSAISGRRI